MQNRFKQLLEATGLSANKFAETIGVQPSSVSHIIAGRNKPGYDFIVSVLRKFPHISPDWLILGRGDMYRDIQKQEKMFEATILNESSENTVDLPSFSIAPTTTIDTTQFPNKPKETRKITRIILLYSDHSASYYDIEETE